MADRERETLKALCQTSASLIHLLLSTHKNEPRFDPRFEKKRTKIFKRFGPNCSKKRWRSQREEVPGKGAVSTVSTDRSGTPLEECLLGYPGDYMARINDSQNAGPCRGITVNVLGIIDVPRA